MVQGRTQPVKRSAVSWMWRCKQHAGNVVQNQTPRKEGSIHLFSTMHKKMGTGSAECRACTHFCNKLLANTHSFAPVCQGPFVKHAAANFPHIGVGPRRCKFRGVSRPFGHRRQESKIGLSVG